ncbi:SIR2 family transcriptional regulator (macronuclear) [Tetrahymena thermophila SB210]|uniref:SIR2 family transcriptional regulator n=1 Tax=Tetrahymena thermophila (strain SB210) TaxID=312017 RepID=I7M420_TETTS|nr:SIR2 family transcriptional regulator [Tetrahymena thermophila SB210]EAS04736.2 SIR2 family transcriptional regulator [Tetrahymena thermophila SB210]|eukprot:XP_001024981.2 SIR2 family transcriptional regulator [Tetrahymena thermophila SB210]
MKINKFIKKAFSTIQESEYSKYFSKNSVYHQKDKFLFNPRLKDTQEHQDSPEQIDTKVNQLIELLQKSKNAVILTGAGVSTASGIPDYRSGANTILKTGPGKWELEENKKKFLEEKGKPQIILAINAFPSPTHMAISKLYKENLIKSVITQNVDNLHHQSGIPRKDIHELHGNIISERCEKCNYVHYRDFYTRLKHLKWGDPHNTGRICQKNGCDGQLHDTLVFFGESVLQNIKQSAQEQIESADLCIVVGTSLTVQSAARLVWISQQRGIPIVIINLQKTSYDSKALKINGLCEPIFDLILKKLNFQPDKFTVQRDIILRFQKTGFCSFDLFADCESFDGSHLSAIKQLEIWYRKENGNQLYKSFEGHPYYFQAEDSFNIDQIKLNFFSHHKEKSHFIYDQEVLQNGQLFSMSSPGSLIFLTSKLTYEFQDQKDEWIAQHKIESYK